MSRLSPAGLVRRQNHRRRGHTGLVISGGGTRASFHLGALRYLYDEARIAPTTISGTSAGAILAAYLAQGWGNDEQRSYLDLLERLAGSLSRPEDVFVPLPWFERLTDRAPAYLQLLEPRTRPERSGYFGRTFSFARGERRAGRGNEGEAQTQVGGSQPGDDGGPAAAGASAGAGAGAVAVQAEGAASRSGRSAAARSEERTREGWTTSQVLTLLTRLPQLGRAGSDLQAIFAGAQSARAAFEPGPVAQALLDPANFDAERVRASGVQLRVSVVSLESGELRYVDQDGRLRTRTDEPVDPAEDPGVDSLDLGEAVLASCSIPGVFPPVRLGNDHYVDGGIRENLPAEVTAGILEADDIWALSCHPAGAPPADSFAEKDMIAIMMRSATDIMSDEQLQDEIASARAAGARVIEPSVDLHDSGSVEMGLTRINWDHGWIRAAQIHQRASAGDEHAATRVIAARKRAWDLEELWIGAPGSHGTDVSDADPDAREWRARLAETLGRESGDDPRADIAAELGKVKREIADLVAVLPTGGLPSSAPRWSTGWELHEGGVPELPVWSDQE